MKASSYQFIPLTFKIALILLNNYVLYKQVRQERRQGSERLEGFAGADVGRERNRKRNIDAGR
jgi:flagellar biogenesis protein FliO